jgi:hypothetical protein
LQGAFLYTDPSSGKVWELRLKKDGKTSESRLLFQHRNIWFFAESAEGEPLMVGIPPAFSEIRGIE